MHKNKYRHFLVAFGFLFQLSVLHAIEKNTSTAIEVTDFAGNVVTLNAPAKRIIALAPHIVENIYSVQAQESLVGVVKYSDFPKQAKSLPIVGDYYGMNYELIRQLNPDLILAWESGNGIQIIERLKQLGFNIYLDHPRTLSQVSKSLMDIGVLTGKKTQAKKAVNQYINKLNTLKKNNQNKPPIRVFYQVWHDPLQTLNDQHIISDGIRLCNGVNIFGNIKPLAPLVSKEALLIQNPQAIITSGMENSRPEWLKTWSIFSSLQAVKNNHLFLIEPNHIQRHTVRILLGVETLCQQLDQVRKAISQKD